MNAAPLYAVLPLPTRTPERMREDVGHGRNGPPRDGPACRCPACGEPFPDAAEALQEHERFLKWLFDRQDACEKALAFSIYDGLAQRLVAALLHLQSLQQQFDSPTSNAEANFEAGMELLREGIREAGRIAGQMHPPVCPNHEITLGVEYLIQETQRPGGPEIVYQIHGEVAQLPAELESAAFRIIRELLTNACRHSGSEVVRLEVANTKSHLRIEIEDWGAGFDLKSAKQETFGLQEVRQRARLLGGEMTVDSAPGSGTRVAVTLPVEHRRASETNKT
jgi:signal transduction histidine kinase